MELEKKTIYGPYRTDYIHLNKDCNSDEVYVFYMALGKVPKFITNKFKVYALRIKKLSFQMEFFPALRSYKIHMIFVLHGIFMTLKKITTLLNMKYQQT